MTMVNQSINILTPQVTIRPYVTQDQEALIQIINQLCAEGRWMYTKEFTPTPIWLHALAEPTCPCHLLLVVCTPDGQLVGWCNLLLGTKNGDVVLGMGLTSTYRERGIGTHLLEIVFDWAWQAQLTTISLLVRSDNARALHLYQKFGFRFLGIVEPPLPASGEWWAMERTAPFVLSAPS